MICLSLALLALGITLYPLISNYFSEVNRSLIETKYTKAVELMDDSEIIGARMDAQRYNATLLTVTDEPYTKEALQQASESYDELLNAGFPVIWRDENRTFEQTMDLADKAFGLAPLSSGGNQNVL